MKFGRSFFGTSHTVFMAFCAACVTPRPAHSAVRMPMPKAMPFPLSLPSLSSVPITGNWFRTEFWICVCRPEPCNSIPRSVTNTNSNGNIEKKP